MISGNLSLCFPANHIHVYKILQSIIKWRYIDHMSGISATDFAYHRCNAYYDDVWRYWVLADSLYRQRIKNPEGKAAEAFPICALCSMSPGEAQTMILKIQKLGTTDKTRIHKEMKRYLTEEFETKPPEPGKKLIGLFSENYYFKTGVKWTNPAVMSHVLQKV